MPSVSLGYSRDEAGGFAWERTNQSGPYTDWKAGEPDNAAPGEDCTMMDLTTGQWSDVPCHFNYSFVCKKGEVVSFLFDTSFLALAESSIGGFILCLCHTLG